MVAVALSTPRLLLRKFGADDAAHLPELCGAFEVSRLCMKVPHPYSEKDAHFFLEHVCTATSSLTMAIVRREDGELMGCVSLDAITATNASIGYWLGQQFWGHGFATEAARSIVSHGFSSLGLERVYGSHFVENPASGSVMAKVGFVATGVTAMAPCMARGGQQLPTVCLCLTRNLGPASADRDEPSHDTLRRSCRLCFSDPYIRSLVRQALDESGWQTGGKEEEGGEESRGQSGEESGANLHWGDFGRLCWDEVLAGRAVGSAYTLKTGVVRKADLLFYLTKHAARNPSSPGSSSIIDSLPTTCA